MAFFFSETRQTTNGHKTMHKKIEARHVLNEENDENEKKYY